LACDFQYPIFQPFSRYIQSKGAHIFHYHADLRAWLNDQLDLVRVDSVGVDLHQSGDSANAEGWRLAAREIEPLVRAKVAALLSDPINLIGRSGGELPSTDEFKDSVARATALTETLSGLTVPLEEVAWQLSGRPQKALHFETPAEPFAACVA